MSEENDRRNFCGTNLIMQEIARQYAAMTPEERLQAQIDEQRSWDRGWNDDSKLTEAEEEG